MHTSQRRLVAATLAVVLLGRRGRVLALGFEHHRRHRLDRHVGDGLVGRAHANGQFGTITTPVCGKAPSGSAATVAAADVGATTGPTCWA